MSKGKPEEGHTEDFWGFSLYFSWLVSLEVLNF